ncbi:MAG: VOC family protein [Rhodospirillales bacterium]|jgi:catechol 2,3-dioxygenase-like lactoylglutathione lyase family enzyme|nr:VOC family protein [Rhodospirillales bacterium]MBT4039619.1 VOC family protein [Rhodospirillales bacterium]MBT4626958.1 VOC family protein [Rhodospirillales bacterium]MBT5351738.1 VOC family protein [Rhodospirillales bacterium]MBT6111141.1 VOC family protein [Rhodospirillales bacterium]
MIDHMGITVSNIEKSKKFYHQTLSALGYALGMEKPDSVSFRVSEGYGISTDPAGDFWIYEDAPMVPRIHIAFSARSRAYVDAFHAAALAAGGTENGKPGLRLEYHPNYYAAFVLDPDGYNIEAVCHVAESPQ